jgi:hypothetical protein
MQPKYGLQEVVVVLWRAMAAELSSIVNHRVKHMIG